jgi:hypothetical protein
MPIMRRTSIVALFLAAAPMAVVAQGKKGEQQACRVSATDAWAKRQAESFDDSKGGWSDDTLRTALLKAAGLTAPLKVPPQLGVQIEGRDPALGPDADDMTQRLEKIVGTRGSVWPTKSVVGGAGVHAVYLLVQRDTGLARAALHRMMEAGPAESPAADVATLEDRMRLVWGRKQIYGTQFRTDLSGKVVLAPMEDSTHADLRREDAGLPPFTLGLCLAKTMK